MAKVYPHNSILGWSKTVQDCSINIPKLKDFLLNDRLGSKMKHGRQRFLSMAYFSRPNSEEGPFKFFVTNNNKDCFEVHSKHDLSDLESVMDAVLSARLEKSPVVKNKIGNGLFRKEDLRFMDMYVDVVYKSGQTNNEDARDTEPENEDGSDEICISECDIHFSDPISVDESPSPYPLRTRQTPLAHGNGFIYRTGSSQPASYRTPPPRAHEKSKSKRKRISKLEKANNKLRRDLEKERNYLKHYVGRTLRAERRISTLQGELDCANTYIDKSNATNETILQLVRSKLISTTQSEPSFVGGHCVVPTYTHVRPLRESLTRYRL